jgi:hypothetical protein
MQRVAEINPFGEPFFARHEKESTAYMDWLQKQSDIEGKLLNGDKSLDVEQDRELSKLPIVIRDEPSEYDAGRFDIGDIAEKKAARDRVGQIISNLSISHRDKFPATATFTAWTMLEETRKQDARCVATDDSRLQGK